MRETAVSAYFVAILIAISTVIFAFNDIASGHDSRAIGYLIVGATIIGLLWSMANWIERKNT